MNLHEMRIKTGLSQSQLADKSGVNVRTLQSYEQGERILMEQNSIHLSTYLWHLIVTLATFSMIRH